MRGRLQRPDHYYFRFGLYTCVLCPKNTSALSISDLRQRRMRMDHQLQVFGRRAHLDRQRAFGNQLARAGARDADAEHAAGLLLEHQLGQPLGPVDRDRAAAARPTGTWRPRPRCPRPCACASVRPHQAISGIGEHDGRNRLRLEHGLVPGNRFHRHARLVRRLVREHRLAGHVANREDRRLGGAPLRVGLDEPLRVHLHARRLETRDLRVRPAADGDEHAIEDLLLLGDVAFEGHANALPSLRRPSPPWC